MEAQRPLMGQQRAVQALFVFGGCVGPGTSIPGPCGYVRGLERGMGVARWWEHMSPHTPPLTDLPVTPQR